ncbi:hypothetical protein KM043_000303 [Ampulex compressa]|nr:hypothetical protein KM043_000303 [Ampulex compressa]
MRSPAGSRHRRRRSLTFSSRFRILALRGSVGRQYCDGDAPKCPPGQPSPGTWLGYGVREENSTVYPTASFDFGIDRFPIDGMPRVTVERLTAFLEASLVTGAKLVRALEHCER